MATKQKENIVQKNHFVFALLRFSLDVLLSTVAWNYRYQLFLQLASFYQN